MTSVILSEFKQVRRGEVRSEEREKQQKQQHQHNNSNIIEIQQIKLKFCKNQQENIRLWPTELKFRTQSKHHHLQNRSPARTTTMTSARHWPTPANTHQHQPSLNSNYNPNPTHKIFNPLQATHFLTDLISSHLAYTMTHTRVDTN